MKITLDQATLAQAVTDHLRNVGVTAAIVQVDFRYTRTPYAVFAEVELSEARVKTSAPKVATQVVETESVLPAESLVDPDNLPPMDAEPEDFPAPDTPSEPLFGGG